MSTPYNPYSIKCETSTSWEPGKTVKRVKTATLTYKPIDSISWGAAYINFRNREDINSLIHKLQDLSDNWDNI